MPYPFDEMLGFILCLRFGVRRSQWATSLRKYSRPVLIWLLLWDRSSLHVLHGLVLASDLGPCGIQLFRNIVRDSVWGPRCVCRPLCRGDDY